jgi:mevalonate kinase
MVKNFNQFVSATAPGKVILFGEHSVVYGYPAISMGISLLSKCAIWRIDSNKIVIELTDFNKKFEFKDLHQCLSEIPNEFKQIKKGIELINNKLNEDIINIKMQITSSILIGSGLGSSASTAVAMIAAFNKFYELGMNKEEISQLAYEMEKIIHGTPSGIDNTTCTYGNLLYFQNKKSRVIENLKSLEVLITYTGLSHKTSIAIDKIRNLTKQFPDLTKKIFDNMGEIVESAEKELKSGNLENLGYLMNINQGLLASLGISNHIIAEINDVSLENGAFGSKLTGAGLGGCVISIGNNLKYLSRILNNKGFRTYLVRINPHGVKINEWR